MHYCRFDLEPRAAALKDTYYGMFEDATDVLDYADDLQWKYAGQLVNLWYDVSAFPHDEYYTEIFRTACHKVLVTIVDISKEEYEDWISDNEQETCAHDVF